MSAKVVVVAGGRGRWSWRGRWWAGGEHSETAIAGYQGLPEGRRVRRRGEIGGETNGG